MAPGVSTIAVPRQLLRGQRRPRVALVGRVRTGKSSLFLAASSTSPQQEKLLHDGETYDECVVEVGLEQISLVDLPSLSSLHALSPRDRVLVKYLLWGDRWPPVAAHETEQPVAAFRSPDVLVRVVDATALQRDLELNLELTLLGKPLVIALNRVDEARRKGLYINTRALSERLGVAVVATVAHMGLGVAELFAAALAAARDKLPPRHMAPSQHLGATLYPLRSLLARSDVEKAFRVPWRFLLMQLAENDDYFLQELGCHFPTLLREVLAARSAAEAHWPRRLSDELRPAPSGGPHLRECDALRWRRRRRPLAALSRRTVSASPVGSDWLHGDFRTGPGGGFQAQHNARRVDRGATDGVGAAVAAAIHHWRCRARRHRRPDRSGRNRRPLHVAAGVAAGRSRGVGDHAPSRFCRRPGFPPYRSARRCCRTFSGRAGLQRAGDLDGRRDDSRQGSAGRHPADGLRSLFGALGDHPGDGGEVSRRARGLRDFRADGHRLGAARSVSRATLQGSRGRHDPGNPALCAARTARSAGQELGADQATS